MSGKFDITRWIVAALLILHIGWIGNHMRWVASGQINPWKLGGYGMYTIPLRDPTREVYDAFFPGAPLSVNWIGFDDATRFTNDSRTFRCADVPAAALLAFFDDNRDLIGKDLAFVYSEQQFVHDPPSIKTVTQGEVVVTWQDTQTFTYTNKFCGNEHVGTATTPFEFGTLP
jgi:hypothetical protein